MKLDLTDVLIYDCLFRNEKGKTNEQIEKEFEEIKKVVEKDLNELPTKN